MGTISVSLPSDGETADAADYNTPINTIVSEINGNLDNNNIKASAGIVGTKLADSAISTAKIADDAVTDAKMIYGKLRSRQGGSSTNWGTSGTNTYDYSATDVFEQCGTASGNSGADVTVTFPTAFAQVPNIIAVCSTAVSSNCYVVIFSKSATNFVFRCIDAGGTQRSEEIFWRAIGQ